MTMFLSQPALNLVDIWPKRCAVSLKIESDGRSLACAVSGQAESLLTLVVVICATYFYVTLLPYSFLVNSK